MFKKKLKNYYSNVSSFFTDDIIKALEKWDNRKEESIKAKGTNPTYDRYDPKYGLHSEPPVQE